MREIATTSSRWAKRNAGTLNRQLKVANALRERTNLPIPKHHCCTKVGDRLPLMVMERLPGEQLRTIVAAAESEGLRSLGASLGACLATFHEPEHLDLVAESEGRSLQWLFARALDASGDEVVPVRRYLKARLGKLTEPAIPALEKADQDLRDFLADPDEFDVTGMLDWERVYRGDGVFALTLIFFRLWLNGKVAGWEDCLTAYNRPAARAALQCPHAEFYLMSRAVLASRVNEAARELVHPAA